jgi:membrane peptidoglycan carboxypeptidase
MRQALAGSLNIPAVQTLYLAGIPNVLDTAKDLGYTTLNDPSRFGLSLVLGGGDVTLLEHTSAFATFAREGQRHPPTPILRIEDKNGRVLEEFEQHETTAIEQQVAQQITDILTDNGARAYIFGTRNSLTLPDRPVAAKTGTTNDFRDAWTMGYTPSIAVGVWVGNNDNSEMKKGADGSVIAAPIWQTYLKDVLKDSPVETFHKPKAEKTDKPILQGKIEGEEKILVDRVTGKRIPSSCKDTYPKDFVTEKTYNDIHSILYYVDKDNPRGPIPEHPEKDLQFDRFEEPVRKWAEKNGTLTTIPSDESCSLRSQTNQPVVTIVSPAIGETVSGSSMTVTIESASTRAMKRVEYYIDNEKIGTSTALTSSVNIDGLTTGFHTLEVVVFDDVENSGSALRDINYLPVVETVPVSE